MISETFIDLFKMPDTDMVFRGCYVYSCDNKYALLNQRDGTWLFLDQLLFQSILHKKMDEELQFKLFQRGFLYNPQNERIQDQTCRIEPAFFLINLTDNCNFNCSYCFRNLTKKPDIISPEVLEDICGYLIDYFHSSQLPGLSIQPWGGEPLLAYPMIKKIYQVLRKSQIPIHYVIETNASIINDDIAQGLYNMGFHVGLSMDGPPEVHNLQRVLASGLPSLSYVEKGFYILRETGFENNISCICVLTANSRNHIDGIIDYFVKQNIHQIKLNFVNPSPIKGKDLCVVSDVIAEMVLQILYKVVSVNEGGYELREANIVQKLRNILYRDESNICNSHGCMGGRRMLSFDRKGDIYPCELTDFPEEKIGSIYDGRSLCKMIEDASVSNSYYTRKKSSECSACPWLYYCGGGCTSSVMYSNDKNVLIDKTECLVNKTIYPELIKLTLTKPEIVNRLVNGAL